MVVCRDVVSEARFRSASVRRTILPCQDAILNLHQENQTWLRLAKETSAVYLLDDDPSILKATRRLLDL